ncbi:unnamed protein product [Polarella glacialis]|uniref:Uncharacterized protein n=1 Tax=Polarella glacialis TaxID=89957 RepID=A0A813ENA8_POLGL|nr:unnamed protein product [Polarella glacialis]
MAAALVLTSFAFVAPARTAFSRGGLWHAFILTMIFVICAMYHVCDTGLSSMLGLGVAETCPPALRHMLTLANHGGAHFCMLQMAVLVLARKTRPCSGSAIPKCSSMQAKLMLRCFRHGTSCS